MDWAPGQNDPAAADDCNGRCHPTPKNLPGTGFKANNTWFLDSLKKNTGPNAADSDAIKAWLSDSKFPPVSAPPPPKVEPKPTVKPGAPADAAALNDQAKEMERQARLSMDPEQKSRFYQSALSFRLLSGDDSGATGILNELDGLYKKSNNETGQKFVAASRLWVEGKPDEALKALADLEKEAGGAGWAFNQQYSHQRSMLLQSVAAEKLKSKDYEGGKALLMQALLLTPTDQLTSKILKLMADHGDADILQQRKNIESLETQRERLVSAGTPCNTSCHTSTQDKLSDFDNFPSLNMPGMAPTPDLTPYRGLKLSYQQKLQLHDIDAQLVEARKHLGKSSEAVETLLFVQKLDEPKMDIAEFEAKYLKGAKAFDGPDRSLPHHLAGEAFLAKKEWAKAATALQAAVHEDPSLVDAQFSLGHAHYATGDFKASRDAYTEILKHQPQDVMALRYRADANTLYLTSLDPKLHADEITKVNTEIASDRALLMARFSATEKEKLTQLGKQLELLHEGGEADLATRKETLDMMELMAKQYLALAETQQPNVGSAELVRKEMNALASQSFDLLAKFAKADSDPEIKKRASLYEGYSLLAQGKVDEAVKTFKPHRAELPEIEKILGTIEKQELRMVNLAALDTWEVYNEEGSAIQTDNQNGVLGKGIGLIEGAFRDDGKDFRDDTKARWKGQVAFVAELRSKIESGKADTILDAMKLIEADGPESMKADARYHINYEDKLFTGYPLGALVHLV
ncbi:MAG TPA: tetratricopeptide repeat protein, partial [bacterium]|nr:tetratricopeptide repeat protein [bacterium]